MIRLLLVSLSLPLFVAAQLCEIPTWTNGCSVPLNLPFFYKDKFRVACNHHDVCYTCGITLGIPREYCDARFRFNMEAECLAVGNHHRCSRIADLYHKAVRTMGRSHYVQSLQWTCLEDWVSSCLT